MCLFLMLTRIMPLTDEHQRDTADSATLPSIIIPSYNGSTRSSAHSADYFAMAPAPLSPAMPHDLASPMSPFSPGPSPSLFPMPPGASHANSSATSVASSSGSTFVSSPTAAQFPQPPRATHAQDGNNGNKSVFDFGFQDEGATTPTTTEPKKSAWSTRKTGDKEELEMVASPPPPYTTSAFKGFRPQSLQSVDSDQGERGRSGSDPELGGRQSPEALSHAALRRARKRRRGFMMSIGSAVALLVVIAIIIGCTVAMMKGFTGKGFHQS